MLVVIWCFLPFLFIFWNMNLLRKRKSVSYEIKKGQICFDCKSDLNLSDDKFNRIMDSKDFKTLCVPCNRDRKIDTLNSRYLKLKYSFQSYLVSKNSDKLIWWFMIPVFSFIILDIILKGFGIHNSLPAWIYGGLNISYCIINIYKTYYTTIKKPLD